VCGTISSAEDKAEDSIFKYKNELSITDKQEKNLRDILTKLQGYIATKTKELDGLRSELGKMIADKADLNTIKTKLQNIARIQADATYEDIAGVRAIEKELTAAQMAKWRSIQEDFRKKQQNAQAAASKAKDSASQQKVVAR
jgi:regulator of replication initiation timing